MIKTERIKRAEMALHEAEQALRRGSPGYVAEEWQKISDAWRELESECATPGHVHVHPELSVSAENGCIDPVETQWNSMAAMDDADERPMHYCADDDRTACGKFAGMVYQYTATWENVTCTACRATHHNGDYVTPEQIAAATGNKPMTAHRKLIGPAHAHLDAPCTDACYEDGFDA